MRASVLKFLEADVEFLKANNIMDYSLMVGVHNVPAGICCLDSDLGGHRENGNPKYGIRSCCNDAANGAVRDGAMSPTGRYQPSHSRLQRKTCSVRSFSREARGCGCGVHVKTNLRPQYKLS